MKYRLLNFLFMLAFMLCCVTTASASWVDDVIQKAEQGDAFAQTALGVCYELGEGIEQDSSKAVHWYEKAAEAGWPGGLMRLGLCYDKGIGVAKDVEKAIQLWTLVTTQDFVQNAISEVHLQEARTALARKYRLGDGVEKDVEKAKNYASLAADWGLPDAEYELGLCFLEGTVRDEVKAKSWLQKALEGGVEKAEAVLSKL